MHTASRKPKVVLGAALTYLTTVKEVTSSVVVKNSIVICPYRKLHIWAEEMTLEFQRNMNSVN
jgi:hypothetical protein